MEKLSFKRWKIVIVLLAMIIFSLSVYAIIPSTCCLNPLADNTCNELEEVLAAVCCTPIMAYDVGNTYGGRVPTSQETCTSDFHDSSDDCETTTKSNACKIGYEICCCDSTQPGSKSYEAVCDLNSQVVLYDDSNDATDGGPCVTECSEGVVAPTNNPPTATLISSTTSGDASLVVTFTMNASDDGSIASWTLDIDNDGTAEYTGLDDLTTTSKTQTHRYQTAGTYTAKLTVTDNGGLTNYDTVSIIVSDEANNPPTATLIALPITGTVPLPVSFTISGSDADGSIVSWALDIDNDGTAEYTGLDDLTTTSKTQTHRYQTAGTYTAKLTVTDNGDLNGDYTVSITVSAEIPEASACSLISELKPPTDLDVYPDKGIKILNIEWYKPQIDPGEDSPESYRVYKKCESGTCDTNTNDWYFMMELDSIDCPSSPCLITDKNVSWNTVYRYKVSAVYSDLDSDSIHWVGSPGDFACEGIFDLLEFCNEDRDKSYTCTGLNKRSMDPINDCNPDKTCIEVGQGAMCRSNADLCREGSPFDMYFGGAGETYTYYDFSKTIKDTCYNCENVENCYDYRSQTACSADGCKVGKKGQSSETNCLWRSYGHDFKNGVCVNTQKEDNCEFCSNYGESGAAPASAVALNNIFDMCTSEKARLLSVYKGSINSQAEVTPNKQCQFDSINKIAKSCEEMTCADYDSETNCGINLGTDVPCALGVCKYRSNNCIKDANDDDLPDCGDGDESCYEDMEPPIVTIKIPEDTLSGGETIGVHVYDNQAGIKGTYVCFGQNCRPKPLTLDTNGNGCEVTNEIRLRNVNQTIRISGCGAGTLVEGTNYLKYYAEDTNSNPANGTIEFEVDATGPTVTLNTAGTRQSIDNDQIKLTVFVETDEIAQCHIKLMKGNDVADAGERETCYSMDHTKTYDVDYGTYSIIVKCWDRLDNEGTDYTFDSTDDTDFMVKNPEIEILEPEDGEVYDVIPELKIRTQDPVSCRYSKTKETYDEMIGDYGNDFPIAVDELGGYTYTLANTDVTYLSHISAGSNTFYLACKGATEATEQITFAYDTEPPSISFIFPLISSPVFVRQKSDGLVVIVDLSDDHSGIDESSICIKIYPSIESAEENTCKPVEEWTYVEPRLSYPLPDGLSTKVYTISVTVADNLGISGTVKSQLEINENVPSDPTLTFRKGTREFGSSEFFSESSNTVYDDYHYFGEDVDKIIFTFEDAEPVIITAAELDGSPIIDLDEDPADNVFYYTYEFEEEKYEFTIKAHKELGTDNGAKVYGGEGIWLYYLIIDKTPPVIGEADIVVLRLDDKGTLDDSDDEYVVASQDSDDRWLTNTKDINITGIYDDVNIKEITFSGNLWTSGVKANINEQDREFTVSLTLLEPDGAKTITIGASDKANNLMEQIELVVKLDRSAPTLTVVDIDMDGSVVAIDSAQIYYTRHDSFSITGTAEAGSTIRAERNGTEVPGTITNQDGEFTLVLSVPDVEGYYEFTINAIDAAGNYALTSVIINVEKDTTPPEAISIGIGSSGTTTILDSTTLERGALRDIWIEDGVIRSSYNHIIIGKYAEWPKKRSLIRFYVGDILSTAQISSAEIMLYHYIAECNGGTNIPIDVNLEKVLNGWNEDDGQQKTIQSTPILEPSVNIGMEYGWKTFDITSLAQEWVDGSANNYGVLLWAQQEDQNSCDRRFHSREYYTVASLRPKLIITYTIP